MFKKNPLKKEADEKKRLEEKAKERKTAEEEIEAALAFSTVKTKRKKKKKKAFRRSLYVIGLLCFIWLCYYLFKPFEGSKAYGVCKVFLELTVEYPMHLRLSQVEEYSNWVRIWYTKTDAYGEYRMEPIQCYYAYDENLGYHKLERVTIRRREIDQKKVEAFNKTIPALLENPPDLTLPTRLPDALKNLRFDVNKYIKPIL